MITVTNTEEVVVTYVSTDVKEFGGDFRRLSKDCWEQRMGESWETVYNDEELEVAFQTYITKEKHE